MLHLTTSYTGASNALEAASEFNRMAVDDTMTTNRSSEDMLVGEV